MCVCVIYGVPDISCVVLSYKSEYFCLCQKNIVAWWYSFNTRTGDFVPNVHKNNRFGTLWRQILQKNKIFYTIFLLFLAHLVNYLYLCTIK